MPSQLVEAICNVTAEQLIGIFVLFIVLVPVRASPVPSFVRGSFFERPALEARQLQRQRDAVRPAVELRAHPS